MPRRARPGTGAPPARGARRRPRAVRTWPGGGAPGAGRPRSPAPPSAPSVTPRRSGRADSLTSRSGRRRPTRRTTSRCLPADDR